MAKPISRDQLRCLQTLWHSRMQHAGVTDEAESREMRYEFIRLATLARAQTTKELTAADARRVLRLLTGQSTMRIEDAAAAHAAGTHGRRGFDDGRQAMLAGAAQFALVASLQARLGWDQARLDAFVSRQLGGGSIRTMADANKVIWPMKRMIRAAQVEHDGAA